MTYVLVEKGAVKTWPYSFSHLRRDNPMVSFPREINDAWLEKMGIHRVSKVEAPSSSFVQDVVEVEPILVNEVWTQQWKLVDVPFDVAIQRQKQAELKESEDALKADNFVSAFLEMSSQDIDDYVDTHITENLNSQKAFNKKLAKIVQALAKRLLQD